MLYFLSLACLIFFSACQKPSDRCKQTLRINIESDPQTLDPRKARDLKTITLMRMLFEGLTRVSPEGQTELALAEKVDVSDDQTRYVFHLRKSVWSNGEPVTSLDFAESWKSILDPEFPTDIANQLYPIKNARKAKSGEIALSQVGIETPDEKTLIVQLEAPTPYFLELASLTSFFPVPRGPNSKWAQDPASHIGNGPFSIRAWTHGDQVLLLANPLYWESGKVKMAEIELFMVAPDTEMRMFEEGELDWAGSPLCTIPSDSIADLKEKNELFVSPLSGTAFLRVNTSKDQNKDPQDQGLLSNGNFRKALSFALDRQAITDHVLQGGYQPAWSLVPPEMGLVEADLLAEDAKFYFAKALKELKLEGKPLKPLVISYKASSRNSILAQAIQQQWEKVLGIKVELEAVEPKVFFQRISKIDFEIILSDWIADFNDPINFLDVFKYKSGGTNCTHWESPKYIDLLNRSDLCGEEKQRKRLMKEAEAILMDEMPIIPIFHYVFNYMQNKKLENVVLSPIGQIDFRWAEMREIR